MFVRSDSDHPIDRISSGLMIAIGGEPAGDTLTLIDQQKQVVERELAAVPTRAEGRGAEFVAKARPQLDKVLGALRDYGSWLDAARESMETGDTGRMVEAYESSHDIIPNLNSAVEEYGVVYAAYGPYKSVPANGMDRLADGIATGEVQPPAWKEMCDYYANGLMQKVESVKSVGLPGKSFLVEGYEKSADQVAALAKFDPRSKPSFASAVQSLDEVLHQTEQLEFLMSQSLAGPTTIAATNVMAAMVNGFKSQAVAREVLDSALDDYGEIMDNFSETFEESVSKPIDSVLVQEEIPRTLDTLDAHYAAVEELIAALEAEDMAGLDTALNNLVETAKKLDESRNVYAAAVQHENQVTCPSCSRSNPPENRLCEACGETLPRSAEAAGLASSTFSVMASQQVLEENKQLVLTENVARLFDACDAVAVGEITEKEFLGEVNRAKAGLKDFASELDEVAEMLMDRSSFNDEQWAVWETQHLPHLEDVAQGFLHGMAEANEGLEKMASYLDDPNDQHLVRGVRQVWEGLGVVHRANLSMQTYSKMLDDVMSEAKADGLITAEG
jgi:tetratricopeptide (TPR) repeat protein